MQKLPALSVSYKEISYGYMHSNRMISHIQAKLEEFYSVQKITPLFGVMSVKYVCGIATRYACWTLSPNDNRASHYERTLEGYALWLSIVWIIDGFFDKCRSITSAEDQLVLMSMVDGNRTAQHTDPRMQALFDTTGAAFDRYEELVADAIHTHPVAALRVKSWLKTYFGTLTDTVPIGSYYDWRLKSGGMVCVIWQVFMFKGIPEEQVTAKDLWIGMLISMIVSFHNDVLSLARDLHQHTPNMVSHLKHIHNHSNWWDATIAAIKVINDLYTLTSDMIAQDDTPLSRACQDILVGSYCWTNAEQRYQVGIDMLKKIEQHDIDGFNALLNNTETVAGDPNDQ